MHRYLRTLRRRVESRRRTHRTAEIYAAVESLDEIIEGLAIGQDWKGDVRVVLFVRLKPAVVLDEPLRKRIRDTIRAHTTPRHFRQRSSPCQTFPGRCPAS